MVVFFVFIAINEVGKNIEQFVNFLKLLVNLR